MSYITYMTGHTTIRLRKETKKNLESVGKFGESHDDLLCRLIEYYKNNHRKRKKP